MKKNIFFISLIILSFCFVTPVSAQEMSEEEQLEKMIEDTFNDLTDSFKLDDIQQFYVDSILRYNYTEMMNEYFGIRKQGALNTDSYRLVVDKWQDRTDIALEKIFTKEQWAKYLKSPYGKEKKRRDQKSSSGSGRK